MDMAFLWTETGAASFLRLSEREVKRLVEARQIPFVLLPGGQVRFDPDDLAEWCKTFRRPPVDLVPADRMLRDLEQR